MAVFLRVLLFSILISLPALGQDRWGVGLSSGMQNLWRPFQEKQTRPDPVPIALSAGRVFMLEKPEIALWFYGRVEGTRENQAIGIGYRAYSARGFGERGSLKAFVDLFLSTPYVKDRVGPPQRERSSGTFLSAGLSHFFTASHAIEFSVGLYTTRQYQDRGFALQPAIGYSFIPNPEARRMRMYRPRRNPTRCPKF